MKTFMLTFILCFFRCGYAEETCSDPSSTHCLELARALTDSNDLCSSLKIYNQIIEEKEIDRKFDGVYVQCLHDMLSIYIAFDPLITRQLLYKLKIHDKQNMPISRFENGYLIMENLPPEMVNSENRSWIYEITAIFGIKVSEEDIVFQGNTMKVKIPSCCFNP